MSLITEVSKQNERDGRLIISGILRVTCLAFPSPPPPSHSNPRSGPNRTAFSHSGRAKFARAMKVSKSGRKNQFAPEKKCRIWRCSNVTLIYILSDKNLKHVLRITLSVFERYESFLLTPDIFKPICSMESVKFQWPHAIEYNSPVSRVLVTKEPRLVNTITFPAHPGRPRGSQSGRDKRRSKRFSSTGGRDPVDNFLPTSFPTVAADLASDWRRKTSVFLPNQGVESAIRRAWKPSSSCFLPTRGWEIQCVFMDAQVSEGVEQTGGKKTANFTWEWSLKNCIAINGWRLHACRFSLSAKLLNERGYTKFIFELERLASHGKCNGKVR